MTQLTENLLSNLTYFQFFNFACDELWCMQKSVFNTENTMNEFAAEVVKVEESICIKKEYGEQYPQKIEGIILMLEKTMLLIERKSEIFAGSIP